MCLLTEAAPAPCPWLSTWCAEATWPGLVDLYLGYVMREVGDNNRSLDATAAKVLRRIFQEADNPDRCGEPGLGTGNSTQTGSQAWTSNPSACHDQWLGKLELGAAMAVACCLALLSVQYVTRQTKPTPPLRQTMAVGE
jgi:hypothetical protein